MTGQLAFDLPPNQAYALADFFPSPANAEALLAAQTVPRLLLVGPCGAGKTHLAHIWAAAHSARLIAPADLAASLPDIAPGASIALDNADQAPDDALFHLYNILGPTGRLILTATTPPRDWGPRLPDLISRLQTLTLARLDPPDDTLLTAVLVKLFADRQITVPANLITYLTARMPRSIDAARALVAALDARALAQARPITRALAAELLDQQTDLPLD